MPQWHPLESNQASGQNINVYPEVSGTVKEILVKEGQDVHKEEDLLLQIDESIQRATVGAIASAGARLVKCVVEGLRAPAPQGKPGSGRSSGRSCAGEP